VALRPINSNRWAFFWHGRDHAATVEVNLFGSIRIKRDTVGQFDQGLQLRLAFPLAVVLLDMNALRILSSYSCACVVGSGKKARSLKCGSYVSTSNAEAVHPHVGQHLRHKKSCGNRN